MHLQGRSHTSASPEDAVAFLQVLKDNSVEFLGIGGSQYEAGGEFAFALPDDDLAAADAIAALTIAGYEARLLNATDTGSGLVVVSGISANAAALHDALAPIKDSNTSNGKRIIDVVLGLDMHTPGKWFAQVYSESISDVHVSAISIASHHPQTHGDLASGGSN